MKKCIGCGAIIQIENPNKIGYVKKMDNEYCLRCFRIKNYNDLIEQDIDQDVFIKNVKNVIKSKKNPIFYYVVDVFDLDGSRILELEKILKDSNVVIVANKIDLLPKSVKLSKIRSYVQKQFSNSFLNGSKILLATSFKQNFIFPILNLLLKNNDKQYFIGSSNVGKSSLINSIMRANKLIPVVVESRYFNTTLDFIEIKLNSDVVLVDTPGVARKNSTALLTDKKNWDLFYFKKELKQTTFQLKTSQAVVFGGMGWFETNYSLNNSTNSFHIYANKMVDLHRTKSDNAYDYIVKNKDNLKPLINNLGENGAVLDFEFTNKNIGNEYDILISGLGWINFKVIEPMVISFVLPTNNEDYSFENMITLREALI